MSRPTISKQTPLVTWVFGLVAPLLFTAGILAADFIEGPKTAFVGVIACVPLFAAIFGNFVSTSIVSVVAVASAAWFGFVASDGNAQSQLARIAVISLVSVIALIATGIRMRREREGERLLAAYAESNAAARLALIDVMTGLPNRRGVLHRLRDLPQSHYSVVLFDCDKLKRVNDGFGHLAGDAYINHIAHELNSDLSSAIVFGRWGGDEFLAVLPEDERTATELVTATIDRLIQQKVDIDGATLIPQVSAGVARWDTADTIDVPLREADIALYSVKSDVHYHVLPYSH